MRQKLVLKYSRNGGPQIRHCFFQAPIELKPAGGIINYTTVL